MANIIDALVVTLGLDDSGYKKGQATAKKSLTDTANEATKRAKEIEQRGQQAAKFFSSIKTEAISLLAVLTAGAGLKSFISGSIESSAAVGFLAQNIHMATEATSAWQNAAARSGGTAEAMAGTLRNVSGELTKFKMGLSSDFVAWFARAGGNFTKLKEVNGTLMEMSRIISDLDQKDPGKALMVAKNMGVDEATFNFLRRGPAYVQAQLDAQKKLGVVTDEDAKRAQIMKARLEGMRQASEKLGRDLLTKAAPAIEFMIDKLTEFAAVAQKHGPAVVGFFTAIAVALAIPFAETIAIAAALAAVAVAIGFVYEAWQDWIDGGTNSLSAFFQFFADTWKKIDGAFGSSFDAMGRFFKAWLGGIVASVKFLYALFFGTSEEISAAWGEMVSAMGKYWESIFDVIKTAGPAILSALKNAWGAVFTWLGERIMAIGGAIVDGVKNAASAFFTAFKAVFMAPFNWLSDKISSVWDTITGKKAKMTVAVSAPTAYTPPAPRYHPPPRPVPTTSNGAATVQPRGIRNNNPGNLNFAGQQGAIKEGGSTGRFAVFESMQQGVVALARQLKLYQSRGIDTISAIVKKYAPEGENNVPAYIEALSKSTGVGANEKLNLDDLKTLVPLLKGIIDHENGKGYVSDDQIAAGARLATATNVRNNSSTNTSDVKINSITIQTQATDARGIARDTQTAFRTYPMIAPQSNTGLF